MLFPMLPPERGRPTPQSARETGGRKHRWRRMGISGWTILGKLKKRIPVPIPDSLFNFLTPNSLAYRHLPKAVFDVLTTEFGQNPRVYALFNEFLRVDTFQRYFVVLLLGVARGKAGDSWEVRRLAALMLQHQVWRLPAEEVEAFDFVFTQLNLKAASGIDADVKDAVLKEGFSTTTLRGFIQEFQRKLERFRHVHQQIDGKRTSPEGVQDFIHLSRRDCKLLLARYLFTAQEVIDQIRRTVRRSKGGEVRVQSIHPYVEKEAARSLADLPDFEADILRSLCQKKTTYWVSDTTSSSLNALVEYPIGTVVLVIKPPGSDIEFEIKRVGLRGPHPLSAVYKRDGRVVPVTHRLDGGSNKLRLAWDAQAVSIYARVFRLVHGREAPVAKTISLASKVKIPVGDGEAHLDDYFSDAQLFGEGFEEMRQQMKKVVTAFRRENNQDLSKRVEDKKLANEFIRCTMPGQTVLVGTSSFRLPMLDEYLSGTGPELYFERDLEVAYTPHDARRFADELLEEVLGVYVPPEGPYQDHEAYLETAYAMPENRARADGNYLCAMRQIGEFWGTLWGIKGCTWGESFVARNVGLRSVWKQGQWTIKTIFMDHDNLRIVTRKQSKFKVSNRLRGMTWDERFIFGGSCEGSADGDEGETKHLQQIYRVATAIKKKGKAALLEAMAIAFRKTTHALKHNTELRDHFHPGFLNRVLDWETIVASYLAVRGDRKKVAAWKKEATALLNDKDYGERLIKNYLEAIETYDDLLARYAFLYHTP